MGADQHLNSERLRILGLGVSLAADAATVEDIRDALDAVLKASAMAQRLRRIREELLQAVGPDEAIAAAASLGR